jgi:cytochrome c oxidase subunit III
VTAQRTLDVSHLPPYEVSSQSPVWWGQLLLACIEASMFFLLIAMYFYIRLSYDIWPAPGTQLPHLAIPTIALVPLFASVIGSYVASEAAKKNDRGGMLFGLGVNLILAITFLILRWIEWSTFNFNWKAGAYGSIVWTMLGLHTLDAVADVLFTIVLLIIVAIGRFGGKQRIGVHVDSILWYFIVLIWIPMYVTIYWGPHLVGAP